MNWPNTIQPTPFSLTKFDQRTDFLPLHIVRKPLKRQLVPRQRRGKMVAKPLGKSILERAKERGQAYWLFLISISRSFGGMDLSYFGRGLFGSWPQGRMPGAG